MENVKIIVAFILAVACLCAFSVSGRTNTLAVTVEAVNEAAEDNASPAPAEISYAEENEISDDTAVTVAVNFGDTVLEMDAEEYLIHVLAGEVSPTYSTEALKAQAVAARTYSFYKQQNGGCAHGGDVCVFSSHCQAYKTTAQMEKDWGEMYDEYYSALKNAVNETANEIMTYSGKPICALYHSSSVGYTEDCSAVFGGSYPYLVSVDTPLSENDGEYKKEATFSMEEIIEATGINENTDCSVKINANTASGRVKSVLIGNTTVSATVLRAKLNLRSTAFTVKTSGDKVTFICYGFGHGVGMSQHGANIMAQNGATYVEILTHYYSGIKLEGLC